MANHPIPEADDDLWKEFIDQGSREARDRLIMHYQKLVHALAWKIGHNLTWHTPHHELVSAGQSGLIKAVDRYDLAIGPFKKLASTLIFGAIVDELRRGDWLPRKYRVAHKAIQKAREYLGDPTTKEIAEFLEWDERDVVEAIMHVRNTNVTSIPARPMAKVTGLAVELKLSFLETFDSLSTLEQAIIAYKYYFKIPLRELTHIVPAGYLSESHSKALDALFQSLHKTVLDENNA